MTIEAISKKSLGEFWGKFADLSGRNSTIINPQDRNLLEIRIPALTYQGFSGGKAKLNIPKLICDCLKLYYPDRS